MLDKNLQFSHDQILKFLQIFLFWKNSEQDNLLLKITTNYNEDSIAIFEEFGEFSMNIMVIYFVEMMDYNQYLQVREKINFAITSIVYQNGASFAATEFFADIEGAPGDAAFDRALDELRFHCNSVRLLGTYVQTRDRG